MLECPYCHARGRLRVKWTRDKAEYLRRYAFECLACGEPVTGWLTLDAPAEPPAVPQAGAVPPATDHSHAT